jgi:preprotein translocase subunit SecA
LFTIDEKTNGVELTDNGIEVITQKNENPTFFILCRTLVWRSPIWKKIGAIDDKEKLVRKEEIIKDYGIKAQRIHTVNQLAEGLLHV